MTGANVHIQMNDYAQHHIHNMSDSACLVALGLPFMNSTVFLWNRNSSEILTGKKVAKLLLKQGRLDQMTF